MVKVLGTVLFVVGVVLLVTGFNAADSLSSDFSRLFTGNPTDKSVWLIVGGIACILVGAGGWMTSWRRSKRT